MIEWEKLYHFVAAPAPFYKAEDRQSDRADIMADYLQGSRIAGLGNGKVNCLGHKG